MSSKMFRNDSRIRKRGITGVALQQVLDSRGLVYEELHEAPKSNRSTFGKNDLIWLITKLKQ